MTNPRKIALISTFFGSHNPGGGISFSSNICREWLNRGHTVHVFCCNSTRWDMRGLETYRTEQKLILHSMIQPRDISFPHRLSRGLEKRSSDLIKSISPDVIHIHNFHGMLSTVRAALSSGYYTVYTALDFGLFCQNFYLYDGTAKPCAGPEARKCTSCVMKGEELTLRNGIRRLAGVVNGIVRTAPGIRQNLRFFSPKWRRYLYNTPENIEASTSLVGRFDQVIVPSPAMRDMVLQFRKKNREVQSLIYPVTRDPVEADSSPLSNKVKLLFLGNSAPIKGWGFFLRVLETLPDGLSLNVVDGGGNGYSFFSATEKMKRYFEKSERIPSKLVQTAIREADAVVVPSQWHENSPLVVLESLANHRPVIASDQAGIRHLITNGQNGILVEPQNIESWKEMLIRVSRAPEILRNMRPKINFDFSVSQYVDKLEELEK